LLYCLRVRATQKQDCHEKGQSLHNVKRPNDGVDRAARFHATFAASGLMRNTLPPLRSNDLFDACR
jgi:hypothetical protein